MSSTKKNHPHSKITMVLKLRVTTNYLIYLGNKVGYRRLSKLKSAKRLLKVALLMLLIENL